MIVDASVWSMRPPDSQLPFSAALSPGPLNPNSSSSSSGVSSINSLTGALTLSSSDSSVTITPSGTTIDLKATGGSGGGSWAHNPSIVQSAYERSNTTSSTVTLGSAPTVGNLLLAIITGHYGTIPTTTAGFGLIATTTQPNQFIAVFTRTVQSGDPSSYTWTTSDIHNTSLIEISGAGYLDVSQNGIPSYDGSGTFTFGIAQCLQPAILLAAFEADGTTTSTPTAPTGYTLLHAFGNDGVNHTGALIQHTSILSPGTFGATPSVTWAATPYNGAGQVAGLIGIYGTP